MKKLFLLLTGLLGLLYAHSQALTPDLSFAGKGWTYTDFVKGNNYYESALQVLPQEGGTYLVLVDANNQTLLTRYLPNGTLDKSYGSEGFSELVRVVPFKAARHADGKIVVAGVIYTPDDWNFALTRYHSDGTVDQGFGNKGIVTTDFGGNDVVGSVAIQPDGRIVVAGITQKQAYPYYSDFALARYLADGTLDNSFDGDGKVTTDYGGDNDDAASVALQEDGKIVAAGRTYNLGTSSGDFALARYHPDGTLDGSFGSGGKLTTDFGGDDMAASLALQEDGKIVAAGNRNDQDFALARYNGNGSLDGSFGVDGKVTTDFSGGDDMVVDLAVQRDGKIVAVGNSYSNNQDFALARYHPNGTLDNSFDGDGQLTTGLGKEEVARSLLLPEDGTMIVAGRTSNLNNQDFVLVRYNGDGSPDNSFDGDGTLTGFYPVASSRVGTVAVQPDGKVVVAGRANTRGNNISDFALARYHSDGSPDVSFGHNGIVTTDFLGADDGAYAVAVQSDGKIVAVGEAVYDPSTSNSYFALARYNPDGSLDDSFGEGGKVTTGFGGLYDYAFSVALQQDGKIVAAGRAYNRGITGVDFALARYNPDGSLDESFGQGGKVSTDFGGIDEATSLVVQSDGRLVVAGSASKGVEWYTYDFALARYHSDGSLDNTFDGDGKLTADFSGSEDIAYDLVVQCDGRLVVAGSVRYADGSGSDFALARYNGDGSPDSSFNGDGRLTTDFGNNRGYAHSLVLQQNGKLLVTGFVQDYNYSNIDFGLVRYNPDGSLDNTFGNGGQLTRDFGSLDWAMSSYLFQNRLFVAGYISGYTGRGVLAAYRLECGDQEICGNRLDDNCDGQIDEGCPAQPFLTLNDVTVSEDLQRATLMVTLSKKMDLPVSFSYFTQDRTAVSKANKGVKDFESESGTLTIPAGQQTVVISINILDDNFTEGEEYFDVHLQRPVGAALSGDKGRVTIQDGQPSVGIDLTSSVPEKEEAGVQKLSVTVQPNPSGGAFTLVLQSPTNIPVTLKITDASGRLVDAKAGIAPNTTLQVGHNYRPGVYYADVVQGSERVNLKLVKQAH